MSKNLVLAIGVVLGIYYLFTSNKGHWYYLNDNNEWIRFSVPMNEKIIEAAYESQDDTVIYSFSCSSTPLSLSSLLLSENATRDFGQEGG